MKYYRFLNLTTLEYLDIPFSICNTKEEAYNRVNEFWPTDLVSYEGIVNIEL